jgi:hypothetical protein
VTSRKHAPWCSLSTAGMINLAFLTVRCSPAALTDSVCIAPLLTTAVVLTGLLQAQTLQQHKHCWQDCNNCSSGSSSRSSSREHQISKGGHSSRRGLKPRLLLVSCVCVCVPEAADHQQGGPQQQKGPRPRLLLVRCVCVAEAHSVFTQQALCVCARVRQQISKGATAAEGPQAKAAAGEFFCVCVPEAADQQEGLQQQKGLRPRLLLVSVCVTEAHSVFTQQAVRVCC